MSTSRFKFRVWDQERKEMLEDVQDYPNPFCDWQLDNSYILMQYTGLLDKNSKEIFESDVIRWDDASGGKYWRVAQVLWGEQGCWVFRTIKGKCINCYEDYSHDFQMGSFIYTPDTSSHGNVMEILGNIYENPDLLTLCK